MPQWLVGQQDFIFFLAGVAWLLVAVLRLRRPEFLVGVPWSFLGLFALLHGLNHWIELLLISEAIPAQLGGVRLPLTAISYVLLFEFGRRGLGHEANWAAGWWLYLPLGAGVAALVVLWPANPAPAVHIALGLPACLWACWAIWSDTWPVADLSEGVLRAGAVALVVQAIAGAWASLVGEVPPPGMDGTPLETLAGPLAAAVSACCALLLALGSLCDEGSQAALEDSGTVAPKIGLALGLVALLAAGWVAADRRGATVDGGMRTRILSQVTAMATTLDPEMVRALSFTAADSGSPVFRQISGQMASYSAFSGLRSIYTMAQRNGQFYFGPESIPAGDPLASPPGTVYESPTAATWSPFLTGRPGVAGPIRDEYGTFVSALAPMVDPETGQVLMVVGIDVPAETWLRAVGRARLVVMALVLLMLGLLVGSSAFIEHAHRDRAGGWLNRRSAGVLAVAVVGTAVALLLALVVREVDVARREADACRLADVKFQAIAEAVSGLRRDVGDTVRFIANSQEVSDSEFRDYVDPIVRRLGIEAMGWAPGPEAAGNEGGGPYRLRHAVPPAALQGLSGPDLSTAAPLRGAVLEAVTTGFAAVTGMMPDPLDRRGADTFIVMQSVTRQGDRRPDGLVLAKVTPQALLTTALPADHEEHLLSIDLVDVSDPHRPQAVGLSPRTMARFTKTPGLRSPTQSPPSVQAYPLFTLGRSWVVSVGHGPGFAAASSSWAHLVTGVLGLLLTAVVTVLTAFLGSREAYLEQEVAQRTGELQASEERLASIYHAVSEAILIHDADSGAILDANEAASELFGYELDQFAGLSVADISLDETPYSADEAARYMARAVAGEQLTYEWRCRDAAGRLFWSEAHMRSAPIGGTMRIIVTARDVTERKQDELRLQDTLRRNRAQQSALGRVAISPSMTEGEIGSLAREVTEAAGGVLRVARTSVWLFDEDGKQALCEDLYELPEGRHVKAPALSAAALRGGRLDVFSGDRHIAADDVSAEPRLAGYAQAFLDPVGITSLLTAVIRVSNRSLGALTLAHTGPARHWEADEIAFACQLADQMAIAITNRQRRRAEEAQEAARRLLQTVVEQSPVGLAVARAGDGALLLVNEVLLRLFMAADDERDPTLTIGQVTERRHWQYLQADGTPAAPESLPLALAIRGQTPRPLEYRIRRKDGSEIWVMSSATPVRDADGQLAAAVLAITDITDRKHAEQALAASEEQMRGMLDAMSAGVLAIEPETLTITYVNPAAAALLGYPPEDIIGRPWAQFARFAEPWTSQAREEPRVDSVRDTLRAAGGRDVPVLMSVSRAHLGGRQFILQSMIDLSSLQAAEEEKARLEERLLQAQKMEAVGQLAGGVAHDFNNLLQVMNGYTELALDDLPEGDPVGEKLQEVAKAGERAAQLVGQLLAFSRRQIMRLEVVDLNEVVTELLKMLARLIGEHIRLQFAPGHDLSPIRADRGMVEQVIVNLCVNARDAMPDGGDLQIETAIVTIDPGQFRAHPDVEPGPYVLLTVTDTGHGMDATTLSRVFEPFFTTKEVGRGTGLGLSTVYGIVRQHGGLVQAYSEVGIGTTFKVYLPAAQHRAKEAAPELEGPLPAGSGTILFAEDDGTVRGLTVQVLRAAGYTVLSAADGRQAISLLQRHGPAIDLLLLDVVMPGLGGRAVMEHARRMGLDTPVLFASGYSDNAVHTNFVLEEGLRFLQKPYRHADLLRRVHQALTGDRS